MKIKKWLGPCCVVKPLPAVESEIILIKLGDTVLGEVVHVGHRSTLGLNKGDRVVYRRLKKDVPEGIWLEVSDEDILAKIEK